MPKDQIEILLVEDDPDDLEPARHALNEGHVGNQIHVARDGEEALDFLFCRGAYSGRDPNCHPRLRLVDLKLPQVDGLEVLDQPPPQPAFDEGTQNAILLRGLNRFISLTRI